MRLSQLWTKVIGFKKALASLFILSILLQTFALVSPYYMQWVVDEVLVSQDRPLLTVLAVGFGLLAIINIATSSIRSWLVLRISSLMNMQMGVNLLHHLLRLPMSYFEKRHIGDIVSRFGSISQIRERLTSGVIETLVDGVMSLAILVLMLIYSVQLTLVVLLAITIYTTFRITLFYPLYHATEEVIQASAKQQTNFLENIRGIQTIKLFNNETQRQNLWQNRYADVINSEIKIGKLSIGFSAFSKVIFSIENISIIYMAANDIINGTLSIGMMLAFIAYKSQLSSHLTSFIEQLIEFKMLKLHLERVSDIALCKKEEYISGIIKDSEGSGNIEISNINFEYDKKSIIFDELSFKVNIGESVAIVGPSGCGKTTLMKIMTGLLHPDKGKIKFNGQDITKIGLHNYRNSIGVVMQNDILLSGSIADNISFFDPEPNMNKIKHCAYLSSIDNDIDSLPMGYDTLVGDMGSQLSGGQTQRIIIARALYKEPKILFLDEATSNLDLKNEKTISRRLKEINITKIIIAHRKETIMSAEKILVMKNNKAYYMKN